VLLLHNWIDKNWFFWAEVLANLAFRAVLETPAAPFSEANILILNAIVPLKAKSGRGYQF
jgi:hypothetical protein